MEKPSSLLLPKSHRRLVDFSPALFRTAIKFDRRVHFMLLRKMLKPPFARPPTIWTGLNIFVQMERWTALMKPLSSDLRHSPAWFNSTPCQFNTWMKQMVAQVDFYLSLNALLLYGKLAYIRSIKVFLLLYCKPLCWYWGPGDRHWTSVSKMNGFFHWVCQIWGDYSSRCCPLLCYLPHGMTDEDMISSINCCSLKCSIQ